MKQLQSSNYTSVSVKIKGEDVLSMPVSNGLALMEYLTKDGNASHVQITTASGDVKLINKFEIQSVTPITNKSSRYKTAKELGMPDLSEQVERVWKD